MVDTAYVGVPVPVSEFPSPDDFVNHLHMNASCVYLSVDASRLNANGLYYLASGMSIQIIHTAVQVEVSKRLGCSRSKMGEGRYYSEVKLPFSFVADYTYTAASPIAVMRIQKAYYVPRRGSSSPSGYTFRRTSLTKIREMAHITK